MQGLLASSYTLQLPIMADVEVDSLVGILAATFIMAGGKRALMLGRGGGEKCSPWGICCIVILR